MTTAALRQSKGRPHPEFFVISNILFASSGWINVLLWSLTGRQFGFTRESTLAAEASLEGGSAAGGGAGGALGRKNRDEEELEMNLPLASHMSHPYPNARNFTDPYDPDHDSDRSDNDNDVDGPDSRRTSSAAASRGLRPDSMASGTSASTRAPSPNSRRRQMYNLPNFPGEQDDSEYAEYSRNLPDYGGDEFWARHGTSAPHE